MTAIPVELSDEQVEHIAYGAQSGLLGHHAHDLETLCDAALHPSPSQPRYLRQLLDIVKNDTDVQSWLQNGVNTFYRQRLPDESQPERKFTLWCRAVSGGDGSASVRFHQSREEAERAEANESEGWAETSISSEILRVRHGVIERRTEVWDHRKEPSEALSYLWLPLEVK